MADGRIIIETSIDNKGAEKGIGELNKKAQDGLKTMNKAFLLTTTAVAGVGLASAKVGMDFEAGMSKVQAISGATGEDLKMLTDKAKEMGAKTKFSATESAEALQYMAMAGWKTQDMMDGLPGIMNLAAASGEDLAMTSDIVTDALTAFGMKASDSGRFADILASASSNANTNVAMLGESFKYVAPLAGSLGYNAEDTSIALGIMANSGIKASQAGTTLKTALVNMAKPTDAMAGVMDKYGISLTNTDGSMKSLKEVMDILRENMGGLDEATKANAASTLFGKESLAGMLAVINASPEDYDKLTGAIYNSEGASQEMADTMNNNLKGSLTLLGSALEGAGIAFYEKFSGPAKEVIDNVAKWFSDLTTKLSNGELDNTLSGIATALATVGTGLLVFNVITIIADFIAVMKGAAAATKLVSSAQAVLNAVMAMNPIGWIIIAISALVAGLIVLWNTNEDFRNAVTKAWNAILDAGKAVWGWLVKFFTKDIPNAWNSMIAWFGSVGDWFVELWGKIKQGFVDGWNSIVSFFTESIPAWWEGVKQSFVDGLQAIGNFFTETIPALIQKVGEWFNELPYKIGYALGFALTTIIQWGVDTWNSFTETCTNIYNTVTEWFSQLPGRIWEFITNAYNKIVQWGTNTLNNFILVCSNVYYIVSEWFKKLPGRIWEFLVNAYNNVVNWGTQTYNNMVNTVSNAVNAVIEWFAKLPGRIWEWLLNTIKKVIQFGKELGSKSREAGGEMVKDIIGAVKDLPSKFWDIGVNIVKGIWEGIKSVGSWLNQKVTGFFEGMLDGAQKANEINSPSRLYRDEVGKYMAQGVGVGFEDEADNVQKSIEKDFKRMAGKMQLAVDYNMARTTASIVGRNGYRGQSNVVNNNDNGITQNVTIVNPERTPSENARALKKVGRDLAFGD